MTSTRLQSVLAWTTSALIGFAAASCRGDEGLPKENANKNVSIQRLRDQARRAKQEFPELFDYLDKRDRGVQQAMFEMADAVPNPDDLPEINIPFKLDIVELLRPSPEEQCRHFLQQQSPLGIELPAKTRAKLYWYCVNGIYLRTTSLAGLAKDSHK